jgi:hypothetical protein
MTTISETAEMKALIKNNTIWLKISVGAFISAVIASVGSAIIISVKIALFESAIANAPTKENLTDALYLNKSYTQDMVSSITDKKNEVLQYDACNSYKFNQLYSKIQNIAIRGGNK